jgi:hypothetical protein
MTIEELRSLPKPQQQRDVDQLLRYSTRKLPSTARIWAVFNRQKLDEKAETEIAQAEGLEAAIDVMERALSPYRHWITGKGIVLATVPNAVLGIIASFLPGPAAYLLGFVGSKMTGPMSTEFDQKFPPWVRAAFYPQTEPSLANSHIRGGPVEQRAAAIIARQSATMLDLPRDGISTEKDAMTPFYAQLTMMSTKDPDLAAWQFATAILIFSRRYRQIDRMAPDHASFALSVLADRGYVTKEFFASVERNLQDPKEEPDEEIVAHAQRVLQDIMHAKGHVEEPVTLTIPASTG